MAIQSKSEVPRLVLEVLWGRGVSVVVSASHAAVEA